MPCCSREVLAHGLCEPHYAMAYPDEPGMARIQDHIEVENLTHPLTVQIARRRHERERKRRAK